MACSRCGKKAKQPFIPASTEGARPRPVLRQRTVPRDTTPTLRPAQQPAPPPSRQD